MREDDFPVILAGLMEVEFALDDVSAKVFDFEPVCGDGTKLCVNVMPVACSVGFFGPKKLVADIDHLFIAEGIHNFAVNFFVVAPHFQTADGHWVFLGLTAIVGNLDGHGQVKLVFDGRFNAAVTERVVCSEGKFVALPYGNSENLRCDGVEAFDAELTWRSDVVFVQADFKMQMGISDAGTSRECECVAFAESGVGLDGNIVTVKVGSVAHPMMEEHSIRLLWQA